MNLKSTMPTTIVSRPRLASRIKWFSLLAAITAAVIVWGLTADSSDAATDLGIETAISLPGSGAVYGVAVSPDESKVFVTRGREVYVVDTATNAVSDTITFSVSDLPTGMNLIDVEAHPTAPRLYVVATSSGASRQITLDSSSYSVITVRDNVSAGHFLRDVMIPRDATDHYFVAGDTGWIRVRVSDEAVTHNVSPASDNRTSYGTVSFDGTKIYGQKGNTVSGDTAYAFNSITGSQLGSYTYGDAGGGMLYTETSGQDRVLLFVGDSSISQNSYVLNADTAANVQTLGIPGISLGTESVDGDYVIVTQNRNQSGGGANSGLSVLKLMKDSGTGWAQVDELELVNGLDYANGIDTAFSLGKYYVADSLGGALFVVNDLTVNEAPEVIVTPDVSEIEQGDSFEAVVTFEDTGSSSWSAVIEWDDSSPDTVLASVTSPFNISHPYTSIGDFEPTITVTDDGGLPGEANANVSVITPITEITLFSDSGDDGIDPADILGAPHKLQISGVGDFVSGDTVLEADLPATCRLHRNSVYGEWQTCDSSSDDGSDDEALELEFAGVDVVLYNDSDDDGIDEADKLADPHKAQVSNVGDFVTGDTFYVPPTADITFRLHRNSVYGDWNAPNGGAPINFPAGLSTWELEFATVEALLYNNDGAVTVSPAADLSEARYLGDVVTLIDGRVLIAGGLLASGTPTSAVEIYDPATDTWTAASPMLVPRYVHTLTVLDDGRVLAAGGANTSYHSTSEIYDPSTDTWTPAANMTTTRGNHSQVKLADGRVMLTGGHNGSVDITSTEIYDPVANTWTSSGSAGNNQGLHTSTLLPDGRVLLTGGTRSSTFYTDATIWEDGVGWTATTPMPAGRGNHSGALLPDGRVMITGGMTSGFAPSDEAWIFDPTVETWTEVASMSTARFNHSAALLPDGRVVAIGGVETYLGTIGTDIVEAYDVATDTWTTLGTLSDPKGYLMSTPKLLDGRVIVVGGRHTGTIRASVDIIGGGITEADKLYAPHKVQVSNVGDFTTGDVFHVPPSADITFRLRRNSVYGDWNAPNGGDPINFPAGETVWELEFATVEVLLYNDADDDGIDEVDKLFAPHKVQVSNVGDFTTGDVFHVPPSADITSRLRRNSVYGDWNAANGGGPINFPAGDSVWELEFATVEVLLYNGGDTVVSPAADLPEGLYLADAVTLNDGRVLIAGGYVASEDRTDEVVIYDPTTDTWAPASPMLVRRQIHTLTLLDDGRVLAAGGSDTSYHSSSEIYDPVTDTWTAAANLTTTRGLHSEVKLDDGRVMLTGGHNGGVDITSTEIYDPVANTWTSAGAAGNNQGFHTSTLLPDGRVLLTGGTRSTSLYVDTTIWEDGVGWTSVTPMPVARGDHSATLLPDGRVMITGGLVSGLVASDDAWIFDPIAETWTEVASMSTARFHHSMALLPDGRVVVMGGVETYSGTVGTDVVEVYDVATDTWTVIGALSDPKGYLMTTSQLLDGRVLVAGGRDQATTHASVDIVGGGIAEADKLYGPHKVQVSNVGDFTTGDVFHVPPTADITFRLHRNSVYGDWNAPNGGSPINFPAGETVWELEFATVDVVLYNDRDNDGIDESDKLGDPHKVQVSNVGDFVTGDEFHVPPTANITFRLHTGSVYGAWNGPNGGAPINFPAGDTTWELEFATVEVVLYNDADDDGIDESDKLYGPHKVQVSNVGDFTTGDEFHVPPTASITFRLHTGSVYGPWNQANGGDPISFPAGDTAWELEFATVTFSFDLPPALLDDFDTQVSGVATLDNGETVHLPPGAEISLRVINGSWTTEWVTHAFGAGECGVEWDLVNGATYTGAGCLPE